MSNVYLAVSVHGTNSFVRAYRNDVDVTGKDVGDVLKINDCFFDIVRRNDDGSFKLHLSTLNGVGLSNNGLGRATDDPAHIVNIFKQLKNDGLELS